jgi:hypothetical protein
MPADTDTQANSESRSLLTQVQQRELFQKLSGLLRGYSYKDIDSPTRTLLRRFTVTEAYQERQAAYHRSNTLARFASDPEYRARNTAQTIAANKIKYAQDKDYRDRLNAQRRERYQLKKLPPCADENTSRA